MSMMQLCGPSGKRSKIMVLSPQFDQPLKGLDTVQNTVFFSVQTGESSEKSNYLVIIRALENKTHEKISRLAVSKEKQKMAIVN